MTFFRNSNAIAYDSLERWGSFRMSLRAGMLFSETLNACSLLVVKIVFSAFKLASEASFAPSLRRDEDVGLNFLAILTLIYGPGRPRCPSLPRVFLSAKLNCPQRQ
jgi:hypothetical protein